ncbi:peptidase [Enterococcus faecium]|nr:peptidase [Enterococcus faecium]EGP5441126.1 peptidase [Enterococcus faecium]
MTPLKPLFIKGFLFVDKIHRLLLYQRFKALFCKKHLSDSNKNFLCGIIHLFLSERCFFV